MKILNFGALNIDYVYSVDHIVQKGETLSSEALAIFPGGKGLNQSVALGRAGAPVWHAGAIGEDGRFLLTLLQEAGVHTDHVRTLTQVRSGNAIIQRDRSGDNCILLYGGANRAITREQVEETLSSFGAGDWLVLQNEINGNEWIWEEAKRRGMKIFLNPSPADERLRRLPVEQADYLLLNEVEAAQLLGEDKQADWGTAMAGRLRKRFPQAEIVLTLGGEGAAYSGREGEYRQAAYRTPVVDTTAAGDTFTGYLLASLWRGLPMEESLRIASRAAAIAVSREGAASSIPQWAEVTEE